jgi:hypothetical protein
MHTLLATIVRQLGASLRDRSSRTRLDLHLPVQVPDRTREFIQRLKRVVVVVRNVGQTLDDLGHMDPHFAVISSVQVPDLGQSCPPVRPQALRLPVAQTRHCLQHLFDRAVDLRHVRQPRPGDGRFVAEGAVWSSAGGVLAFVSIAIIPYALAELTGGVRGRRRLRRRLPAQLSRAAPRCLATGGVPECHRRQPAKVVDADEQGARIVSNPWAPVLPRAIRQVRRALTTARAEDVFLYSAALAFYGLISVAPLVVVALWVTSLWSVRRRSMTLPQSSPASAQKLSAPTGRSSGWPISGPGLVWWR